MTEPVRVPPPVRAPEAAPARVPEAAPARAPDAAPVRASTSGPTAVRAAAVPSMPASSFGELAGGGFLDRLRTGLQLTAADLADRGLDLASRPQPLPGVTLRTVNLTRNSELQLAGDLEIPHVATGKVTVKVTKQGKPTITGHTRSTLAIPALGSPTLTVVLDESGALSGSVAFEQLRFGPKASKIPGPTVTGSGRVEVSGGRLAGEGTADLTYRNLGSARVGFRFGRTGDFAVDGQVHLTPPFLEPVDATVGIDAARNLTASLLVPLGSWRSPLPGLVVSGGSLAVMYENGLFSGALTDFAAAYGGFASVSIGSLALGPDQQFGGKGTITLAVPGLTPVVGTLSVSNGAVSGKLTLSAKSLPPGLPVRGGTIDAKVAKDGQVGFSGRLGLDLGPAGRGQLSASYLAGAFALGAEVDLTVPGLQQSRVSVRYADGALSAEASIPVDPSRLPGVNGLVVVRYAEGRWSGGTTVGFSADDGKLTGSVTVNVAQTGQGSLEVGGSGRVRAQLMPSVAGTLTATILPAGGIDISGAIEVTEPVELFGQHTVDTELFRVSKNIPLWAILVAVVRLRGGVRAGIGPGVFRNIKVTGSYTFGSEVTDPSFAVTGELYIPAYVEGYLVFGAGLGLDVVLGSLTGGIEGVATAGLYGAISVVPELSYADGQWGIEGVATLAAGARLSVALNAWAEIEALWKTIWDDEWKLADVAMSLGPDLALQARMNYVFGRPEPPSLEFTTSDIDASALITEAIPKDGPAPSGARQAIENRAQWKGPARTETAAPVPPELARQAAAGTAKAPPAPPKPPAGRKAGAAGKGPDAKQDPGAAPTPGNEKDRSAAVDAAAKPDPKVQGAVPASALPPATKPRHPGTITMATLDEPPAPLPRTREQEGEDVAAARTAVELAETQAKDTDALDNYFPRIKQRFGLASLGYVGDFQRGFKVVGKINPEFEITTHEPLSGTGIPGDLQSGHITKVDFGASKLEGADVGIRMEASPLGPDHPLGSEAAGQDSLMDKLPVDPNLYREVDRRYVRGHLLNYQLGGPGEGTNLFPITARANQAHFSEIEKSVKEWVNDRRYWIRYTMEIKADNAISTALSKINYINSTLLARASVLDTELKPVPGLTRSVSISSTYDVHVAPTPGQREDETRLKAHEARAIDDAVAPRLVTRAGSSPLIFPEELEKLLKDRIASRTRSSVEQRLRDYRGFGPRWEEVLFTAYDEVKRRSDKTVRSFEDRPNDRSTFTRLCNVWPDLAAWLAVSPKGW